ncbi:hypothetical protein PSACC_00062 [Paramicrosporidium saccamoebae]|uniref:Uncharacterized protein n=1 Tax=Paramicrosporidium saccamoebae TaxID=1246581 RepID=A0A2H9TQU7_9FUNG|nr:hypothetical protein PSACC_00062 [Paramicrosporidium saccamoebae]
MRLNLFNVFLFFTCGSGMWPFGPEAENNYAMPLATAAEPSYTVYMESASASLAAVATSMPEMENPCPKSEPPVYVPPPMATSETCTCPEQPTTSVIPTSCTCPKALAWPVPAVHAPVNLPPCVNLTAPAYCNITTAFRLAPVQDEWWQAQQFCLSRRPGVYCYVPVGCTDCFPTVMLSCPDVVFLACKEGFVCTGDGCRAMVDLLPLAARNYGIGVIEQDGRRGFSVQVGPGQVERFVPKKCRGPMPLAMEQCIHNKTMTRTIDPMDVTDDYYTRSWQIPTPTGTTMCDVF